MELQFAPAIGLWKPRLDFTLHGKFVVYVVPSTTADGSVQTMDHPLDQMPPAWTDEEIWLSLIHI